MAPARRAVQFLAALGWNCAFLLGQPSLTGLYRGPLKTACCPGLNCYACPYAAVSCPLGALQNFIAVGSYHFSLYLGGFLLAVGGGLGRMVCGWLCPFGLFQELLHRIPSPVFPFPRRLRHLRWPVTAVLIVLVPLILEKPGYCAWLCPAGALEG
ncbi:MAG TPA: 4Fe-4S binding protein, partial [bacterium]|nr:4Fe-4S binding protein [bacterium]